ncbi:hypothetical protein ACT3SZ_12375 [Corynebacterium sp. AOP40-9SA-29]|uniref:hypothetical protein n=1 Tax=Corynebacterium sp. AOP40-9SA-29 TaxID=3457677 RepID=UPI004034B692
MTSTELNTTAHDADLMPMAPVDTSVLAGLQQQAEAWGAAAQIAEQLARTDFAGPFKGKPADLAAAILKGAELGIPAASIGKAIYVVHGAPALYGKTSLAIALQHGYTADTVEDSAEAVTVRMTSPAGQSMEVRYTIQRAEQEGLVKGNSAQYKSRPSKMLYWKCIGELTDRMIPHLTGGMPVKEDIEQSQPVRATAERTDRPRGGQSALERAKKKQESGPGPVDKALAAIGSAESAEDLDRIMGHAETLGLAGEQINTLAEAAGQRADELGLVTEGEQA